MGSYFFHDCHVGGIECEEDLNTLKYISTSADKMTFELKSNDYENLYYTAEFFKYLHQKSPFTLTIQKIKLQVHHSLLEEHFLSLFLTMQKYLNKYAFCKKWSAFYKRPARESSFLIKINFTDCIYRLKQVKTLATPTPQLNYFGLFAFTSSYSNSQIVKILLNTTNYEYDHLLPLNLQGDNFGYFLEYIPFFIQTHSLTNIRLPPVLVTQPDEEEFISDQPINSMKLIRCLNNIPLQFIDFSFIIYADSLKDIRFNIKRVVMRINFKEKSDFILRFYLFSKENLFAQINHVRTIFKKIAVCLPEKEHSYLILYIFQQKIVKSDFTSRTNPHMSDDILESELYGRNMDHLNEMNRQDWEHRNHLANLSLSSYTPLMHPLIMTKNVIKFYTGTRHSIFPLVMSTYRVGTFASRIKRKAILSIISQYLSINIKELHSDCKENVQLKNYIMKSYYEAQLENAIPVVKNPKSPMEVHSDLVHIHFDQGYNLLRTQRTKTI